MDDQVPKAVVQQRYERLVALQDDMAWAENRALVGRTVEVLVAEGEGRKDGATHRMSGRARDNRLVHFVPSDDAHGRATSSRSRSPTPPRTTSSPTLRCGHCGVPAAATRGRRATSSQQRTNAVLLGLPSVGAPA